MRRCAGGHIGCVQNGILGKKIRRGCKPRKFNIAAHTQSRVQNFTKNLKDTDCRPFWSPLKRLLSGDRFAGRPNSCISPGGSCPGNLVNFVPNLSPPIRMFAAPQPVSTHSPAHSRQPGISGPGDGDQQACLSSWFQREVPAPGSSAKAARNLAGTQCFKMRKDVRPISKTSVVSRPIRLGSVRSAGVHSLPGRWARSARKGKP
jgi:hypothetical protein